MRMEQYLTFTDHAFWEVIVNGDSVTAVASASAEVLFLLKLDAKSLWEAIKNRFGGNKEDANMKLLRCLPSAWNNIALIMRNKSDQDTLSMDYLYNNLKDQPSTASYADDVMFSFFSNQSNALHLDNEDLEKIDTNDIEEIDLKWKVEMLTMRVKRFIKKIGKKLDLNGKETVGFDRTKLNATTAIGESFQAEDELTNFPLMAYTSQGSSSSSSSNSEVHTSSKECLKSYEALQKQYDQQREVLNKSNLEIIGYQMGLESLEAIIVVHGRNEAVYEEDIAFLKYDVQVKDISIKDLKNQLENALKEKEDLKLKLEKFKTSSKNLTKLINSQISVIDKTGLGYDGHVNESEVLNNVVDSCESDGDDNQVNDMFKKVEGYHSVPPPYTGNYMPLRADLSFAGLDNSVFKPKDWESDSEDENVFEFKEVKKIIKPSLENIEFVNARNTTLKNVNKAEKQSPGAAVLTKSGQVSVNATKQSSHRAVASVSAAKHVNTNASRPNVYNSLPITYSYFKAHSPVKRPFNQKSVAKTNNFNEKVNTAKRPKGNLIDHISKYIGSYTLKRFNYVDPQGKLKNAKGGKITGKGKIRTAKLDFEDAYFVKELKFNLFSVSQMCDKKNSVLFTDTECVVLSPDFKLLDESQVLLKATLDESNLWHRRLGHINFKTMKKLVRGNLVRGLPSKLFENNHTCFACQKGKQHKASCLKNSEDEIADDAREKSTKVLRKENGVQNPAKEGIERTQRNKFKSMFIQDKDVNRNRMFTPVSTAISTYVYLGGSIPVNAATLPNAELPTDPIMPNLEDTADLQDTGILSGAFDDEVEGLEANYNNLELTTMDVKSAFLYGTIEEEVYVCQPPDFEDPHFPNKVYKVEKALYGLHQAPRACQDKYVADILKKFNFSSVKTVSTPIKTNKALLKDEEAKDVDVYLYRLMIGSLMYLTASRPDIMFAVCVCARFQVTPKISHLHAVKRIFRYLKGQPNLGLWYLRDSPFDLEAFSDSDYAGANANSATEAKYVAAANSYGQGEGSTVPVESNHTPIDEAASTSMDVRYGGAATTVTSLDAGQGSGNIDKTPSIPYDLPLPRVNTLGSDEGRMQHNELMDLVTKLLDRFLALETDLKQTKKVYDIHGRYEQDIEFDFDATKEVSTAEQVSTAGATFTTASDEISLASPTRRVSTADDITMAETLVYSRRSAAKTKDKEKEWENIKARVKADEELTQRLQEEERNKYSKVDQSKMLIDLINQRKGYFVEQKAEAKRKDQLQP
uniref:Uncharacterized protein n=1 Tax=Tanacetum cinerariifolium TaxID=118510 RepID=A0A6L2NG04_TANCI|nr:hypothetical protein [Tanacetum cinerariifolium]